MKRKCLKTVWLPCKLKARAKRLACLNNMTCSDLIRLCIKAKLPEHEADYLPVERERK